MSDPTRAAGALAALLSAAAFQPLPAAERPTASLTKEQASAFARLARTVPDLPEAKEVRAVLAAHLTADHLKAEAAYFARPDAKSFERPYGWAWLLKLAEELHGWDDPDGRAWSKNLRPLADVIVARYLAFLPKQTYAIR